MTKPHYDKTPIMTKPHCDRTSTVKPYMTKPPMKVCFLLYVSQS